MINYVSAIELTTGKMISSGANNPPKLKCQIIERKKRKKTKVLNRIVKIDKGHLRLREGNLGFNNNYTCMTWGL